MNKIEQTIAAIRAANPSLKRHKTIVETYDGRRVDTSEWNEPHLEHLINAIPNFKERWGNDDELFKLFGGYRCSYDFTKPLTQNLTDNPELLDWVHGLLVKE